MPCGPGCDTCDATGCTACNTVLGFTLQTNKTCSMTNCVNQPGTYYDAGTSTCKSCVTGCAQCESSTTCSNCTTGFLSLDHTQCLSTCPVAQWGFKPPMPSMPTAAGSAPMVSSSGFCKACDAGCPTCNGDGPNMCTTCAAGSFIMSMPYLDFQSKIMMNLTIKQNYSETHPNLTLPLPLATDFMGMWNQTSMGMLSGMCIADCSAVSFETTLVGESISVIGGAATPLCIASPPKCTTFDAATFQCTACEQGFAINLANGVCTRNPLTPNCLIADPTDATKCALCIAMDRPEMQFILDPTAKTCSNACPAANRKTLTAFTTATIIPPWLVGRPLFSAACTPCSTGCDAC